MPGITKHHTNSKPAKTPVFRERYNLSKNSPNSLIPIKISKLLTD